jgi:hypothetical protein
MRRFVGTIALLALVASPTVAQARMFCRYTGIEITDCEEQRVPDQAVVQWEGCCERRVVTPLGAARISAEHATLAPILIRATAAPVLLAAPMRAWAETPRASGPPLYVVQRALLI